MISGDTDGNAAMESGLLAGIHPERVLNMSSKERRLLNNLKKAFYESDMAVHSGRPEDGALESLFKAVDTAKTLRHSLRDESVTRRLNKQKFVSFLELEWPATRQGEFDVRLVDAESSRERIYTFGEILYDIRCMVHENENLNQAEGVQYQILLDWTKQPRPRYFGHIEDGRILLNGYIIWERLRELLAKFITGLESMVTFLTEGRGASTIRPALGSIRPDV